MLYTPKASFSVPRIAMPWLRQLVADHNLCRERDQFYSSSNRITFRIISLHPSTFFTTFSVGVGSGCQYR